MSRPGTTRVSALSAKRLDPAVALQLLAQGDETSPPAAPTGGLKPLHAVLQEQRQQQQEDEAGMTDSDNGILSDPEETIAQEERLEKRAADKRRRIAKKKAAQAAAVLGLLFVADARFDSPLLFSLSLVQMSFYITIRRPLPPRNSPQP